MADDDCWNTPAIRSFLNDNADLVKRAKGFSRLWPDEPGVPSAVSLVEKNGRLHVAIIVSDHMTDKDLRELGRLAVDWVHRLGRIQTPLGLLASYEMKLRDRTMSYEVVAGFLNLGIWDCLMRARHEHAESKRPPCSLKERRNTKYVREAYEEMRDLRFTEARAWELLQEVYDELDADFKIVRELPATPIDRKKVIDAVRTYREQYGITADDDSNIVDLGSADLVDQENYYLIGHDEGEHELMRLFRRVCGSYAPDKLPPFVRFDVLSSV